MNAIGAAVIMLEQLGCLFRMSMERGEPQLITLREEHEFVELYLAMQGRRYCERGRQSVFMDPERYESSVPRMLQQPIAENAYVNPAARFHTQ
jgi:LytS/YehU family sensor histidine kinase